MMALGWLPNNHAVAVGALHFLILSSALAILATQWLQRSPATWAWLLYHTSVGLLSGALVLQGVGRGAHTSTLAAVGGTGAACWWAIVAA